MISAFILAAVIGTGSGMTSLQVPMATEQACQEQAVAMAKEFDKKGATIWVACFKTGYTPKGVK
jgi:hypothetical protein